MPVFATQVLPLDRSYTAADKTLVCTYVCTDLHFEPTEVWITILFLPLPFYPWQKKMHTLLLLPELKYLLIEG